MWTRWLIAALLVVSSLMFVRPTFAENEPNNTRAEAIPIEAGYSNAITVATLATTDDVDYYKFTAESDRTYVIETFDVSNISYIATGLKIEDTTGGEIAQDRYSGNGTGSANARVVFKVTTSGIYYIRVQSASNWTGTYSLRVLPDYKHGAAWDANNDNEPNDVRELANTIEVGLNNAQTHQIFDNSSLASKGPDQDFYRFEGMAGRTYVIETYNINGTGAIATGLWLYNSANTKIAEDSNGSQGTGNVNARIVFKPTTTDEYFIKVSQFNPITTRWAGTYSLRVLPKYDEPDAAWDANNEPNDVIPLAFQLGLGADQAQRSTIFSKGSFVSSKNDQDYYRFDAEAGTPYVIETFDVQKGSRGERTAIELFNDNNTRLAKNEYQYNPGSNIDAQIAFTVTSGGTYFVRVKNQEYTAWTGPYSIRVCANECVQQAPTFQGRVYLPLLQR